MGFDKHGAVSVFELVIYFPAIVVAAIVCSRHGFGRSSGWIYTLILCLVRIIGACCQLATYAKTSTGLIEAIVIFDSIGISPLLLATLGLLSRCADSTNETTKGFFAAIHFRVLQLLISIGLILCIVGGTSSTSSDGTYHVQSETKIGVILYVIAFIALCLMAVVTKHKLANAPSSDNKLAWAVLIALPLIAVRLLYSIISVFTHDKHFNLLTGSVIIHVFMAIIEEMLVVILYLAFGWASKVLSPAERGPIANRPWKGNLAGAGTGRPSGRPSGSPSGNPQYGNGNGRGKRQGPIHQLVGAGIAHVQERAQERTQQRQEQV